MYRQNYGGPTLVGAGLGGRDNSAISAAYRAGGYTRPAPSQQSTYSMLGNIGSRASIYKER